MKDKDDEQTSSATNQRKKAYHQPQLQVYGNLKDITQSVGFHGMTDGVLVLKTSP